MNNKTKAKIIHVHIYNPQTAFHLFGEPPKNSKAQCFVYYCNAPEGSCPFLEKKQCIAVGAAFASCIYSKRHSSTGFTSRAKNFSPWIRKREEEYKEYLQKIVEAPKILAKIGDYIYLPYSFMDMYKEIVFERECFILKKQFTMDNIIKLWGFRPRSMMGGEIRDYQKKSVPKFIMHLSEYMPKVFKELCEKDPEVKERFDTFSYVGRKVLLKTVVPNVGFFEDRWYWNGKVLYSLKERPISLLVNKGKVLEVIVKVDDDFVTEITNNAQVDENTKFVD